METRRVPWAINIPVTVAALPYALINVHRSEKLWALASSMQISILPVSNIYRLDMRYVLFKPRDSSHSHLVTTAGRSSQVDGHLFVIRGAVKLGNERRLSVF